MGHLGTMNLIVGSMFVERENGLGARDFVLGLGVPADFFYKI